MKNYKLATITPNIRILFIKFTKCKIPSLLFINTLCSKDKIVKLRVYCTAMLKFRLNAKPKKLPCHLKRYSILENIVWEEVIK